MWQLELIALAIFLNCYIPGTSTLKCLEGQPEAIQDGVPCDVWRVLACFGGRGCMFVS